MQRQDRLPCADDAVQTLLPVPVERASGAARCHAACNIAGPEPMQPAVTGTDESRRAVAAATVGNVLEWYDFSVYAFFAATIGREFFPSEDPTASLLATFAVFGVGFVVRPLGGIVIGWMGDRYGRRPALVLTIMLMAAGTVAIGLLPTYAAIGTAAPALLVAARLLQGFSAGGEWGGSTAFMVEWAPTGRRGLYGSFQQMSVAAGLLLGSGIGALVATLLPPDALEAWGWRVPFLLGGVLGLLGQYMRRHVGETPAYEAAPAQGSSQADLPQPRSGWPPAARAFGFTIFWTVSYYVFLNYMPTFTRTQVGLSSQESLWANTIGLVALVVLIPLTGLLSDRFGRKPLLLASCGFFAVMTWPLMSLMLAHHAEFAMVVLIQLLFGVAIALFSGPGPAAIAEIFPTRGRSTWMSTSYALAVALFGGFAPFVATWLIATSGSPMSPSLYVIAAAVVSFLTIAAMPETARRPLS
ncbi:MFS transporter [Falsiroseomonas sp. HW251]|uniref:MFS transporter n=1 Tax=Falsiroseomonas sp. HW251 TaxID=3390998 RepID=UPI003D323739